MSTEQSLVIQSTYVHTAAAITCKTAPLTQLQCGTDTVKMSRCLPEVSLTSNIKEYGFDLALTATIVDTATASSNSC
jgi:hypothetical protein